MSKGFISYRREDGAEAAHLIFDHLIPYFGHGNLFIDDETISPASNFHDDIEFALGQADVLLIVIGPSWLWATDSQGRRRLDDASDLVRIEIAQSLQRGIPILPV